MSRFEYRGKTYKTDDTISDKTHVVFSVTGAVAVAEFEWSTTEPFQITGISEPALIADISMEVAAQVFSAVIAEEIEA